MSDEGNTEKTKRETTAGPGYGLRSNVLIESKSSTSLFEESFLILQLQKHM